MDNQNQNQSNVDIKSYLLKVFAYWKLFLVTIFLAVVVAKFKNDYSQKRYSASTTLSIKEKSNPLFSTGTSIAFNWGGASDQLETVKVTLGSRSHNEKVVDLLEFYVDYFKDGKYRLEDVYGDTPFRVVLDKNKPQLYAKKIKVEILSKDTFRLSADLGLTNSISIINYKNNQITTLDTDTTVFSQTFNKNQAINLPFLNIKLLAVKELKVGATYFIKFNSLDDTVAKYRDVRVTQLTKAASLIKLQLAGVNKQRIVDYLNATIEVLEEEKKKKKISYAVKTKDFIETLFAQEEDSLKSIETEIRNYKNQNNIYDLSFEGTEIFTQTVDLKKIIEDLENGLDYLSSLKKYIVSNSVYNNFIPAPALITLEDSKISGQVAELIAKSTEREILSSSVKDTHPGMIQKNREIQLVKNILFENISTLKAQLLKQKIKAESKLVSYNAKLKRLPNKEQNLLKYEKNLEISESNYTYLKQKSYEAGTVIASNVSDIIVIDNANFNEASLIYPQASFNYLIALMLGVILPLFYIIIKELLDNKIHTVEQIQKNYSIPVLGVIG